MVFEADSDWLVMPCKLVKDKSLKDQIVIYRWRLQGPDSSRVSMITIPKAQAIGSNGWKDLRPSDVTIDPATGNYVIITSHPDKAIVEITPGGQLVRSEPLPGGHNQPEGVAITKDSILMVSDEATNKPAAITLYRWHPSPSVPEGRNERFPSHLSHRSLRVGDAGGSRRDRSVPPPLHCRRSARIA